MEDSESKQIDFPSNGRQFPRSIGVTAAERYLNSLCEHSFLSLWSYPGVFRDQGRIDGKGDGKEVCDLLVVFENHVIIFSDKHCAFASTDDLQVDWMRWYKKAVLKSAEQVWGAERWIRDFPSLLFLDRKCTVPFPIVLPDPAKAIFHRIVVAHDGSRACKAHLGGSGSLMLNSTLAGTDHYDNPFSIGRIDVKKGYVHVFDDTSLNIVMTALDTVSDFVTYLTKKERLLTGSVNIFAAGEEELLAEYLAKLNSGGEHDFIFPRKFDDVAFEEGFWTAFLASPERQAQVQANRVSYAWDALIEHFVGHLIAGTQYRASHRDISEQEKLFRWLARENRTRRRMLAKALGGLMEKTPQNFRSSRVVLPSRPGDPHYVFLLLPRYPSVPEDEYREVRGKLLGCYCQVVKLTFPDAKHIIGIATESGQDDYRSEDLLYLDATDWNDELNEQARSLKREFGIFVDTKTWAGKEKPMRQWCAIQTLLRDRVV